MKKKNVLVKIVFFIIIAVAIINNAYISNEQKGICITKVKGNLYKVINNTKLSIFDIDYQKSVDIQIERLLEKQYKINNPLMIINPYGTNTTGVNIYFSSKEELEISYIIAVEDEEIPEFSQVLKNDGQDNFKKEHQYQVIGLIPGKINNLTLIGTNRKGNKIQKNLKIDMRTVECDAEIRLDTDNGESQQELTDGLFVEFRPAEPNNIYDNNGILRASLPKELTETHRILFYENMFYYKYSKNGIIAIDRLGKIKQKYVVPNYEMHHDYILDVVNKKIIALATSYDKQETRTADMILIINIETGDVDKVIDMQKILPQMYEIARKSYEGKSEVTIHGIDWLHLNSVSMVEEKNDIIISSRETSSIIYLEDIYNEVKIKYIIAEKAVYENTEYEQLVYTKVGDFVSQASQHTVEYIRDEQLEERQYYLIMFNNNWGENYTRDDFPWDKYPGVGIWRDGEKSMYYKYLVDENKKTYELVDKIDVDYSYIVSGVQKIGENLLISPGSTRIYEEYDKDSILIKRFHVVEDGEEAYRVFKYDFKDVWFK